MSTDTQKLSGKVAVVTGAARGLGAAIAKRLAEDGAMVVITYSRSQPAADEVVRGLESHGGKALALRAAIVGLTKGLARDLGPRNITVNNVQPGPTDTDMNPADGTNAPALKGMMAIKRFARGSEIAALVSYLAGPEAGFITGGSYLIDGGFTA